MLIFSLFLIISCGSDKKLEKKSVEEYFNDGVRLFKNGSYLEAKKNFDIIKLQYPASQYADDAQYYMAECEYMSEKYILAAFNFNLLRKYYPNSEFIKIAAYKAALSYFNLAPSSERDQDYTRKAIIAFNEFQAAYPTDSLNTEAGKKIVELRTKLAEREYKTAIIYNKLESPRSALVYFDNIINDFEDTIFIEDAYIGKIEALILMKKPEEAKNIIDLYKKNFAKGKYLSQIEQFQKDILAIK